MGVDLGDIVDAMQTIHAATTGISKAPTQANYPLKIARNQLPFVWTHITDVDPDMERERLCNVSISVICLIFPLAESASWKKRLASSDTLLGRLVALWNNDTTKANSTIKSWRGVKGIGGHEVNWHGVWYYGVSLELVARVFLEEDE